MQQEKIIEFVRLVSFSPLTNQRSFNQNIVTQDLDVSILW